MASDSEAVSMRVSARKAAELLMELGFDLSADNLLDADGTRHFWKCVRQSIDELIGKEEEQPAEKPDPKLLFDPPDDPEIMFGKYKGTPMSELPAGYCQWLIAQDWIEEWPEVFEWLQDNGFDV